MKILLIEPCYENYGGYFRAFGIAKALSLKGAEVDLLLPSYKKFSLKIKRKKINENLTQYNLPHIYINFFITGRVLRGIIGCFFILFKKYDLIHIFVLVQFESNIPFLFAKLLRRKIVIDWDDYWTDAHQLVPLYDNWLIKEYLKFCEYKLQKMVLYASATTDFLMNELEKIGVKNRFKIINGVQKDQFVLMDKDEARKKLNLEKNDKIILTFGHTFFKERTIYLFRIFEKIYKLDNTIKLYFNYDPRKIVKEQCPEEKFDEEIFKNIINIGYLDKDKLSLYMGATDLVLFAMGDTTLEKACFPTRIGTYLNGERIIIMNDTDTEACNILRKYDCAIIGKNPLDLAEKTIEFFNNKTLRDNLEKNVKRAKESLSWDNIVKGLIEFYNKIIRSYER
jgi:glycosyltransferase involved in cell wall biosynthesis